MSKNTFNTFKHFSQCHFRDDVFRLLDPFLFNFFLQFSALKRRWTNLLKCKNVEQVQDISNAQLWFD